MKIEIKYELKIYAQDNGTLPFLEWLESLDRKARSRVRERLDRVRLGCVATINKLPATPPGSADLARWGLLRGNRDFSLNGSANLFAPYTKRGSRVLKRELLTSC